jgi:MoxR-like ATPase
MYTPPPKDPFQEFATTMRTFGMLTIGSILAKDLVYRVGGKFFEMDSLPVKTSYVDWWPNTRQKIKEVGSHFWDRRTEGATVSGISSSALAMAFWFSDDHPVAARVWDVAKRTAMSFFDAIGLKKFALDADILTLVAAPSLLGLGTSLALGGYDVYTKYFNKDRVLETKPIFNQDLQQGLDEILAQAREDKSRGDFLSNVLLYGPPGTGKTMISKWMANHSGMNYICLSGGDLLKPIPQQILGGTATIQLPGGGAAVATLQKLIEHAKSLTTPTVVFIDEAEVFLKKRDDVHKSPELTALLNAFLELTGQATNKMMLILATNRAQDLDSAVLSRMDHKLHVGVPELVERKQIIEHQLQILVSDPEDRELFRDDLLTHIAKQTQGFSGRDLFKLMNRLKGEVRVKRALDTYGIDRVIAKFAQQEHQITIQESAGDSLKKNAFYQHAAAQAAAVPGATAATRKVAAAPAA